MAYSPIEQAYLDKIINTLAPDVEPEPEMMVADSGQVTSDAPGIVPIPQTRFEKIAEQTGMTLEQIGNELDKLGKVKIGGMELGIRDFLPFVGSIEDGKLTGTPAALQAVGRGESLITGTGMTTQLKPDAKLMALDVATAGVAKPAMAAAKATAKGVAKALPKNLPVGNSIQLLDGTEQVLGKAPKIESKAFKNWFGESKAVDEAGRPMVVYHARRGDFEAFDPNKSEGKSGGTGTFFSSSPDVAATYNTSSEHSIVPAYLSFKNPMIVDVGGSNWNRIGADAVVKLPDGMDDDLLSYFEAGADELVSTDDIARLAKRQGYDGVIIQNVVDHGPAGRFSTEKAFNPSNIYVSFQPTQIKSAISNKGTFDPNNPDYLRGAGAGTAGATAMQEENK